MEPTSFIGELAECKKPADREALLKNILAISTHSWGHVNMLGEYDFSEKVDFQAFNLDKILKDGAEILNLLNFAVRNRWRFFRPASAVQSFNITQNADKFILTLGNLKPLYN